MKLSELIRYKELIDSIIPRENEQYLKENFESALNVIETHNVRFPDRIKSAQEALRHTREYMESFNDSLDQLRQDAQLLIDSMEPFYLANSYKLYEKQMFRDSIDVILNRQLQLEGDMPEFIRNRVQYYSDWHHAGLIVRPGREPWIKHMVACDPLYAVDQYHELFEPAKLRFNDTYRNRVRWHRIRENIPNVPILQDLPDGQFGFCLVYNYFHFKPFEIVREYLTEIYDKLKPGGTVAFTFNNCDRSGGVDLTERNFNCFTPGRLIRSLCTSIGYEIFYEFDINASTTWIEAKRSGTLTSIKGGQTLATINSKPPPGNS